MCRHRRRGISVISIASSPCPRRARRRNRRRAPPVERTSTSCVLPPLTFCGLHLRRKRSSSSLQTPLGFIHNLLSFGVPLSSFFSSFCLGVKPSTSPHFCVVIRSRNCRLLSEPYGSKVYAFIFWGGMLIRRWWELRRLEKEVEEDEEFQLKGVAERVTTRMTSGKTRS